jgi:two-component system LytT family response regulator
MTLRALIVDDEIVARRRLRRLLTHQHDIVIAGECGDGLAAVDAIRTLAPDVVFLDVQMPEFDGFEVVQAIGAESMPAVVFVTAYDHYALRAFDANALDYVLKPVDGERLARATERARAWQAARHRSVDPRMTALLSQLVADRRYVRRLPIRIDDRLQVVDLADVDWISAADNYVMLHVHGRELLARRTMAWLERELDPERFVRIHRSTIVQINRVSELVPESHGDLTARLRDGTELTVSRNHRARLDRLFHL